MVKGKKKGKGKLIAKTIAIIIFLVILYIFLPTMKGFVENPPSLENYTISAKMSFEFERSITITTIGSYTLNITIPTNTQFQEVQVKDTSDLSKDIIKEYNRTVWQYHLKDNSKITLIYKGTVKAKVWNIKDSLDTNAIPQSLKKQYNHNESIRVYDKDLHQYVNKIVITPYAFKNVTQNLTRNDTNVLQKLRTIYDVIVNNFRYISERKGAPNTAIQTWNNREGDCDELSFVFVSMARSIGIPAWVEYGLAYTQGTWGPHAWIGSVIPTPKGLVKVNIDTTIEVGGKDYGLGFLIRNADRLTEWVDDGNSEHLNAYYSFIRGYYHNLKYNENVNIIYANQTGKIIIPISGTQIPKWVIILILALVIIGVFVVIIRV